jgi:hypothetical protein
MFVDIDIDRIHAEVADEERLDDFGHPSYREALERFVASAAGEARLTRMGWAAVEGGVRSSLRNRLRITGWHARHPDLARTPVEAPIFIVGLSRTGTTALSHLLARDPALRSLLMWEATDSVPPPSRATYAADPRFERAKTTGLALYELEPELKALHYDPPDAPIECSALLGQHFTSVSLSTIYNLPSYDAWLTSPEHDWRPAYRYHRQALQVLQSEYGGRWQLKHPGHALALDAIHDTYPDARFVVTHRDPVQALASVCSLVDAFSGIFSDADHRAYIAAHWTDLVSAMLDGVLDYRDVHGDADFHDISYRDLVDDPLGAIAGLYDRFGLDLSTEAEAGMRAWATEHRHGEHGRHSYSLADFGLDRAALDERFARYFTRHDVEREAV